VPPIPLGPAARGPLAALPVVRLALETDTAYFQRLGSAARARDYALALVAATREILRRDFGMDLALVYLGLYPDGVDPWVVPDAGGTSIGLLNEFLSGWTTRPPPAEAELYHFLSGAVFDGGVATLATYCVGAFGVSTGIDGRIDWDGFDGTPSFLNADLGLFAHELGHNLGAIHSQDHCPPLDRCVATCLPGVECGRGSLMSYCALCSGAWGNVDLAYHPQTAADVRGLAAFACLPPAQLPGASALRWRVTIEPDPLSFAPPGKRSVRLRLPIEGLAGTGEFTLVLNWSAEVGLAR
jgi:hypothetical protein